MNRLTSQQRKLIYLVGIIVLLVPITGLSLPADGLKTADGKAKNTVGLLAKLRSDYELGESDLGDVDASGAAINLVLLGMRGVAVNMLWIDVEEQKEMKRWAEMQATTESIVRLQPHYEKVWDMNGWNLAYNTSMEWDAVPDRYYWVKQGAKLLKRGVARNKKSTELHYRIGKVLQQKIGLADECVEYRAYFLKDPDTATFKGGPDPDLNPEGRDNYLVAKDWFLDACDREISRPQHITDRSLFRSTPTRCQFDYARGLQKDGKFGESTREAWETARLEWTEKYGKEVFHAIIAGNEESDIWLEMSEQDLHSVAKTPEDQMKIRRAVDAYQNIVNYRYWRMRGLAESEHEMAEAHRNFFESKKAFIDSDFIKAKALAFSGLDAFEKLFNRPEYYSLHDEQTLAEECMLGFKIWEDIHKIGQEKLPEQYPLKAFVQEKLSNELIMNEVNNQFKKLFTEIH